MRFFALLAVAMTSFTALSATKVNVFDTEAIVYEQSADARYSGEELARQAGMRQVIVRATGDSASLDNDVVKKAIGQSSRFLSTITPSENDGQATLEMSFNPRQIQALLAQAELPYWPEQRAKILVWIVEDNGYDRTISWEQSGRSSVANLQQVASKMGLPISVPVGDIDDVIGIEPTELWGGFTEQISKSSQRYVADAVVVARIERNGNEQRLRWTLYDDAPKFIAEPSLNLVTGEAAGNNQQVTEALVAELGRYYAKKSADKASGAVATSVMVNFVGVQGAKQFFNTEKMLKALPSVASIDLMRIAGDSVDYQVNLITDQDDFERELTRSSKVKKVSEEIDPNPELTEQPTILPLDSVQEEGAQPEAKPNKLYLEWLS